MGLTFNGCRYDLRGAFRLLCGLFIIGMIFTATTLPCSLMMLRSSKVPYLFREETSSSEACRVDFVVYSHYLFLAAFVFIQLLQLPFRFRSFAAVFLLGLSAQSHSRENLVESFKSVMERRSWKLNQYLGFVGQYFIPFCGFLVLVLFGEKYHENPCDFNEDPESRPSSIWLRLVICVFARVGFTLLWGYHTTNSQLNDLVTLRGATQTMIDKLDNFKYTSPSPLTRCTICICDFEKGDDLVRLPCDFKHIYHNTCIVQWLKRCKVCPLCMLDIDDPQHEKTS
mmetsp:Transcript_23913/g.38145  ORF Transcript_23913/g.38145 Transcript_23913/m.38145 type:complete len:283 (+) Transcript_23913:41-889(+)